MCIIIYKPEGIELFPSTIKNSFENNADGAGFAYVENGKINIEKGFYTLDVFNEAYKPHTNKQALLHFRIRTHGSYEEDNCHPFTISPNLVFAHNGVIFRMPTDPNKSDTVLFNELVLQNLVRVYGKRILWDKAFIPILEGYTMSKFVFLTNTGQFSIINEKDGTWDSKCWFSNDSYKRAKWVTPPSDYMPKEKKKKYLPDQPRTHNLYPIPHKQEPLPGMTPEIPQRNDRPWVLGDYLRTTIPCGLVEQGWLGRAMSFYQNGDVEMYFPLRQVTKRIPVMYLVRVVPQEIKVEE